MFAPPCDLNSNSVMILTDNHELFIFGPDKNESLQKELEDAVQVKLSDSMDGNPEAKSLYIFTIIMNSIKGRIRNVLMF